MARSWQWLHLLLSQVCIGFPILATLLMMFRDTGVNAIESLMSKKGAFDYILLETTGLADPGNLAPLFWVDDGLGSTIYLDGIVTLVDAKNILRSLDDPKGIVEGHDDYGHGPVMTTAHVQISHADVIVINKADMVTEAELNQVKERIQSINGLAKIHVTERSVVPQLEGFLLDLHAYDQFNESDANVKGHSHLDPVSSRQKNNDANSTFVVKYVANRSDHINRHYTCRPPSTWAARDSRPLATIRPVGQQTTRSGAGGRL